MDNLPIYKIVINDDDTTGVTAIALVDNPAIERNWMAFNDVKPLKFEVADKEQRIISGALMVADLPIFRRDPNIGEFMAVFDKETISKIVLKWFRTKQSSVNMMHDANWIADGVYMFESFIIDKERGIETPKGFEPLPQGSWFGSFKVDNEQIWNEFIKSGEFKGFSVEGDFQLQYDGDSPIAVIEEIIQILKNTTKQ